MSEFVRGGASGGEPVAEAAKLDSRVNRLTTIKLIQSSSLGGWTSTSS